MRQLTQLVMKLRMLFARGRASAQLDDELRFHLDRQAEENRAAGMSPAEARAAALRAFGNPALLRDQARASWSWNGLESLLRDLRYSFRTLRRTPGFTLIAVSVMALGIGANVALFTVLRGVILKPLPFTDPARLVMLYESKLHPQDAPGYSLVAGGVYAGWKQQNRTFSSIALVRGSLVLLSGSGRHLPEKLESAEFSWDLLPTLGVQPVLGRNFTQSDDSPSAAGTVLLSWSLWQRRFGGDAGILNRPIYIDGLPYTVIGVMPSWFRFPDSSRQLYLPVYRERPEQQMASFSDHALWVVGRLKPGISQAQAVADLSLISQRIHNANPGNPFIFTSVNSRTLLDHLVGDMKRPLYVLLAATVCLLLIACLNVSSLLVARAVARRKDFAIRTALGGGWPRLVRERLLESLLLSVFGGMLGVALAAAALQWLVHTRNDFVRVESIRFDPAVAAFAAAVVALCAVVSGAISVFGVRHKAILDSLRESSRAIGGGRAKANLRRVLLSVEVGLTVILLVGAGLLLKSYERLRSNDLGCLTRNVLTLHIGLPDARYATRAQVANFYDALLSRIRALPGVASAGFVDAVPGHGYGGDDSFTVVEHPPLPQGKGNLALERTADAAYFETIGIPILRGRTFNPSRRLQDAGEAVIDESLARTFFAQEDPIGKHILTRGKRYEIVGVAGATRFRVGENPRPTLYTSLESGEATFGTVVLRSNRDVGQFALPVQRIVAAMDPDLALSDVLTMDQLLGKSTLDQSFDAALITGFAVLSLVLAAAGLFGVLSYIVAQRGCEIGIRIALGAQRAQVLRLMLFDGLRPALLGLAFGLAASAAAVRLIRSMLYETQPLDPAVFGAVAALLLLVGVLACLIPAWSASRLDPIQALRTE
jgi:predicted permease